MRLAGKIDENKPGYRRLLTIQLTDIDEPICDGTGLQVESSYWVNKDLCTTDKRSNFLVRNVRYKWLKSKTQ